MYVKDGKIIHCFIKYVKTCVCIQITCDGRVDPTSGGSAYNFKQSALRFCLENYGATQRLYSHVYVTQCLYSHVYVTQRLYRHVYVTQCLYRHVYVIQCLYSHVHVLYT